MSSQPTPSNPIPTSSWKEWCSGWWPGDWPKKTTILVFSSLAIALYGYDQGMMSLVNTNRSYLRTMGLPEESDLVGIIVSIYYLGCGCGAFLASGIADRVGRKYAIAACLITSVVGDLMMFAPGIYPIGSDNSWGGGSLGLMMAGRVVLGFGVGGIDAVIPVYSSELSKDETRGSAMAKEFQANIFGLFLAFFLNFMFTYLLGKDSQWAWRIPIICMIFFPILLLLIVKSLPESPRWLVSQGNSDAAMVSLVNVHGEAKAENMLTELEAAQEEENGTEVGYFAMLFSPSCSQFHPTMITVMGQINQALTGYGAVSVYGPQIFELLGLRVWLAECTTLANYFWYLCMMRVAVWTIDVLGRRKLMIWGSAGLAICYILLTIMGGIATDVFHEPQLGVEIVGSAILFLSTAVFGICWLTTVWLIPTEIYPNAARAKGSCISVGVWGLVNFAVTLATPWGFNHLKYWLFFVFAITNTIAGLFTWLFSPETGGRSFEENQAFFTSAREDKSCLVMRVGGGRYLRLLPNSEDDSEYAEGDAGNAKGENEGDQQAGNGDGASWITVIEAPVNRDTDGGDEGRGDTRSGENADEPSETTPLLGTSNAPN